MRVRTLNSITQLLKAAPTAIAQRFLNRRSGVRYLPFQTAFQNVLPVESRPSSGLEIRAGPFPFMPEGVSIKHGSGTRQGRLRRRRQYADCTLDRTQPRAKPCPLFRHEGEKTTNQTALCSASHQIKTYASKIEVVHNGNMRTTVNLDADVYSFTSAYAGAKGITLSAALGELVRRAEQAPELESESSRLMRNEHGYLEIAETGKALTPEMVKAASEDELV
jgi:hypothetical protein